MSAAAIGKTSATTLPPDNGATILAPRADDQIALDPPAKFKSKLLWALSCIFLFFILYGGCLYLTSLRTHVGTLYFSWERYIPFVPWMIVPYMSIDFFFAGSFFLCRTKGELNGLGRRMMLATVIAAACFLLFPLRYAFDTPAAAGLPGAIISWFKSADRPFNLAPSLHIAYRSIIWVIFVRHTFGLTRAGVKIWFILVGLSTLLVYQHHVIDVLSGQMLAMLCIYLIPEDRVNSPHNSARRDIAYRYAAGSLACVVAALVIGAWGWLLLWPAFSLALVAGAYATGSPDLFRKRAGRIAHCAWAIHWPYLLAHRISTNLQSRNRTPCSQLTPKVWIGRKPNRNDAKELQSRGITTTLDLTAELSETPTMAARGYFNLPILDLTLPDLATLNRAAQIIERAAQQGSIYIHCAIGYGRTAVVAAAYLLASNRAANVQNAIDQVRSARPGSVFSPAAVALLQRFAIQEITKQERTFEPARI